MKTVASALLALGLLAGQTLGQGDDVSPFTPTIKDKKGLAMLHKGAKAMIDELDTDKDGTISLRYGLWPTVDDALTTLHRLLCSEVKDHMNKQTIGRIDVDNVEITKKAAASAPQEIKKKDKDGLALPLALH
jgi:hypothetical protein